MNSLYITDNKTDTNKNKRLIAIFFNDTTGDYKKIYFGLKNSKGTFYDINDENKKNNYIKRHSKMNEDWNNPMTAGWLSRFVLWSVYGEDNLYDYLTNKLKPYGIKNIKLDFERYDNLKGGSVKRIPLDKDLYEKAKEQADKVYKRHSLYKSAYIQKLYREMGGEYYKPKGYKSGIDRWFSEKWINVGDYLRYNKITPCGERKDEPKACRPLKRISKETPITINELIKKYGKEKLLDAVIKKEKNMNTYLNWEKL